MTVRYDAALPLLVNLVNESLGSDALVSGAVLRDALGRVAFLSRTPIAQNVKCELEKRLVEQIGAYAREDRVVAQAGDAGVDRLLEEGNSVWLRVGEHHVRCIDRRVVGTDWVTHTPHESTPPAQFVFSSMKGGVGRSTALCVAARELSRSEKNVLVIDLDLEAPGVGTLLLGAGGLPRFGAMDYLAELVVRKPDEELVQGLVASSPFAGRGVLDVVPAVGTETFGNPENMIGKLSRCLLDIAPDGATMALGKKLRTLVDDCLLLRTYDAVLVDVRSGLSELTAGALLALGGTTLLFGTAQEQTVHDYRYLFAHLHSLIAPEQRSPWRNFATVLAKATREPNDWFLEEMHELFSQFVYEEASGDRLDEDVYNFDLHDPEAPHRPIPIAMNPLFAAWDPARRESDLTADLDRATFGPLVDWLIARTNETYP